MSKNKTYEAVRECTCPVSHYKMGKCYVHPSVHCLVHKHLVSTKKSKKK